MILYKLTDEENRTRAGYSNCLTWGKGVSHTATGSGGLCTDGVIHAYLSPALAVLLNPIHAGISLPRLWEAEGDPVAYDHQLKVGCKSLKTTQQIRLPVVSTEQRIRFAILCGRPVAGSAAWQLWADRWLSGEDRSEAAARAAEADDGLNLVAIAELALAGECNVDRQTEGEEKVDG